MTLAALAVMVSLVAVPARASQDDELVEAWLHAGRVAEALAALGERTSAPPAAAKDESRSARHSTARLYLLAAVLTGSWQTAAASVRLAELPPSERTDYWYVRGMLAARAAWPGGRPDSMDEARSAARELEALAATEGAFGPSPVRHATVLAAMAAAQEERDQLALVIAQVEHLDNQRHGAGMSEDPLLPALEAVGDLWLQVDRYEDAMRAYERAVARVPSRVRPWVGVARAARAAGRSADAREAARRVLTAWTLADPSPALDEMRRLAACQ